MKVSPLVLLLSGALVGALAWGTCNAGRASKAEIRVAALLAQDSTDADAFQRTRDSLRGIVVGLRADSAVLAARAATLARRLPAAHDSLRRLLAMLPDSTRTPLDSAVAVVTAAYESCEAIRANCEARAANAEQRVAGDSIRILELEALSRTLEGEWRAAEQRAKPSFFRDLWRSRRVTLPLMALSAYLLLSRR